MSSADLRGTDPEWIAVDDDGHVAVFTTAGVCIARSRLVDVAPFTS